MDSLPIRALDDSPGATANSVKSDDSSPCHDPGRGSPPPNCAICLGRCRNKSFTDSCLHQFCFKCLLTWSKVKAECPLCKQNFRSIIHNVRSNHQYEEYMVEQRHTEELSERIDIDNLTATRRFRYRTTLTLPRQNTLAIQQLLLHHYPMVAELFPGPPAPRRRSPASFRRTVYRYNLWARPLPDFTHRFRDCSPEFYRHNTSQMHRLVPWLNRELHYLLNENVGHIAYVVARILELLPQYSINSTEFRDAMRRYFGDNTEHFLHELYCFASTPYDMNGYDRHVQYTTDNTISTMVNNVLSSSESDASVDSDIVVVSSSAPADLPPGPSRAARPARAPAPVYPQSSITQPAPDDVIPIETISQSDSDDDSSEVMVVGYIKPPQDRTPEVVDLLGSDSDVIVQESSPPQPPAPCEAEGRSAALVKLTLARHDATIASSSESGRTPSQSPPRRPPHHRADADTQVHRVSPSLSSMSSASNFSYFSSSDGYFLSSLSDSEEDAKLRARCFMPRRKPCPERRKRKAKRRARKLRKNNKELNALLNKAQSKYKSYSGVGVKSSKKAAAGEDSTVSVKMDCTQLIDQPGTSGTSRGASEISHGTSGTSRGTNEISHGTSGTSRGASEISHGTSGTSRGTNEISHGTSETSRGASEIPHGTSGTSRGASEISHGTSGISRGTSEISHGTSGTSRGASGTSRSASEISPGTSEMSRVTSEMSRCTTEMSAGTSEMSHGISDMPYGTRAISRSDVSRGTSDESRVSSVTSRSTSEISRSTSDGSRGTSNESRGSSGISRSTSRTSRGTSDSSRSTSGISRGTSVISRGMSDVSRGTSGISRNTSDVSRGTSEISRGTSGTSHATKRKLEWSSRRCETTRESKRLKSVVNVVNSQNNFDLASKKSINAERAREAMDSDYEPSDTDQSDSEDDLPLNLSIAKRSRQ